MSDTARERGEKKKDALLSQQWEIFDRWRLLWRREGDA